MLAGAVTTALWLADQAPDVDTDAVTEDPMRAQAVHLAIIAGGTEPYGGIKDHFKMLHVLLTRGLGAVEARDAQQCTPLIVAAQYGDAMCAHVCGCLSGPLRPSLWPSPALPLALSGPPSEPRWPCSGTRT